MSKTLLEHWEINSDPFDDFPLDPIEHKYLFEDRKDLRRIRNNIDKSFSAIRGDLGIGKTTLLNFLRKEIKTKSIRIKLTTDSDEYLYREILVWLLLFFIENSGMLNEDVGVNLEDELRKVDTEVIKNSGLKLGINYILKFEAGGDTVTKQNLHSESSAISVICKLLENLNNDLTIIIDDFDRVRFSHDNDNRYRKFLFKTFATIDSYFKTKHVKFLFSLESYIKKIEDKAEIFAYGNQTFKLERLLL
jgi:hypothetical protein